MSGNRWRVKHEWYLFYGESRRVWEIQHLVDGWWETVDHEITWQKAQNEADRQARTITVELPNVGDGWYRCRADHLDPFRLKRGTHKILTEIEGVLVKAGSDVDFHIADNEIEEFALALLAIYHQRKEQQ